MAARVMLGRPQVNEESVLVGNGSLELQFSVESMQKVAT
jgi:hypothetical protein